MLQSPAMTATMAPTPPLSPARRFKNAAEWLASLGGVPLDRILFDPLPGTATEQDLLRYVEGGDKLCELIDGTLVEKPMGWDEALIAANLIKVLGTYVDDHDLGAVSGADTTLRMKSTGGIRLPDVAFVSKDRLPAVRTAVPTLAPDLAVEVLSAGNTAAEMARKREEYFRSGTRLVWMVDPESRTVAIYHSPEGSSRVLDESGSLDGEDVVPGFSAPVAKLFRNVPPTGR